MDFYGFYTGKELCEKAQINKSTFYSHYKDIYDLSDQLETDVVASVIEAIPNPKTVWKIPPFWLKICFSAISPGIPSSGSCFPEIQFRLANSSPYHGDVGALYQMLYGIGRFCVEFLRTNEQGGLFGLTTAQLISIVFIIVSILLFVRNKRAADKEDLMYI